MNIKMFIAALIAMLLCLGTGCSDSKTDSSSTVSESTASSQSSSEESSSETNSQGTSSEVASDSKVADTLGKGITKAAQFFDSENYEYSFNLSGDDGEVNVVRVKKGSDYYQINDYGFGKTTVVYKGGETYCFDTLTNSYTKTTGETAKDSVENIIKQVVDNKLPSTSTHISPDDKQMYDVEEYTYTGDTYITVLDFCFDKQTGDLVKYTATYSVEGQDNETEVRTISKMSDSEIDESGFNTDNTVNLTDFNALTEDERLGFCQTVCSNQGISTDNMNEMGITTDDFKRISYDDFINLVMSHTYLRK